MKTITVPNKEHLSAESQTILESVEKKMGKIPNLYATIGYSSSALKAMLETEAALLTTHLFWQKKEKQSTLSCRRSTIVTTVWQPTQRLPK
jgi:hypothetical protein